MNVGTNETTLNKDTPAQGTPDQTVAQTEKNKAPKKESGPVLGPVMKVIGGTGFFFGVVGVALIALSYIAGLIGFWAIPVLMLLGGALMLGGEYLSCRKNKQKFGIVNAFRVDPARCAA